MSLHSLLRGVSAEIKRGNGNGPGDDEGDILRELRERMREELFFIDRDARQYARWAIEGNDWRPVCFVRMVTELALEYTGQSEWVPWMESFETIIAYWLDWLAREHKDKELAKESRLLIELAQRMGIENNSLPDISGQRWYVDSNGKPAFGIAPPDSLAVSIQDMTP